MRKALRLNQSSGGGFIAALSLLLSAAGLAAQTSSVQDRVTRFVNR